MGQVSDGEGLAGGGSRRPSVVLVHGLGDEADSFRHLFPLLAGRCRVLAPDLPGFGRSIPRGRVGLGACARAVEALVKTAVSGPVILVGSSLGAGLAQLVALRARVEVAGLVLMDGGLPSPPESGAGMAASVMPFLGESRYRSLRGRPEAAFESLRAYYAGFDGLPEADRVFLARRVVERVDSEVQMRAYFSLLRSLVLRAVFGSRAFASFLSSTRLPILIIWGSADRILPLAAADLLAGLAPRARKIVINEAGHLPHQEAPAPTAAAILDFLGCL